MRRLSSGATISRRDSSPRRRPVGCRIQGARQQVHQLASRRVSSTRHRRPALQLRQVVASPKSVLAPETEDQWQATWRGNNGGRAARPHNGLPTVHFRPAWRRPERRRDSATGCLSAEPGAKSPLSSLQTSYSGADKPTDWTAILLQVAASSTTIESFRRRAHLFVAWRQHPKPNQPNVCPLQATN